MPARYRVLIGVAGAALVVGAVVVLRSPADTTAQSTAAPAPQIDRFADDRVVLPEPGAPPQAPAAVTAAPVPGGIRLSWADGLAGAPPPVGAVGYEVRWALDGRQLGTRLVAAPETELDGLIPDRSYRVDVRSVDAFGQRSAPATVDAFTQPGDQRWRFGLTGMLDDFPDGASVLTGQTGSRWHLSGYRDCPEIAPVATDGPGLTIELGCGANQAVLRARQPLTMAGATDGMIGRVAVLTDAAGPGGELTVDLVPGQPDRVGTASTGTRPGPDPALPAGAIRAVLDESGARVQWGPGLGTATGTPPPSRAPARGAHVLHLFEVTVTTYGIEVRQDGQVVATAPVVPRWARASVLLGMRGPADRLSAVHVATAGISGPTTQLPAVAEAPASPATPIVLGERTPSPGLGVPRASLAHVAAARVVTTLAVDGPVRGDPFEIQLGDVRIPAHIAVPGARPAAPGSMITAIADLPDRIVHGGSLTPFVVRAKGSAPGASVVESYLEITPGPQWTPAPGSAVRLGGRTPPRTDSPPKVQVQLTDTAGAALDDAAVPGYLTAVLTVQLDAHASQWDTGGVAGVTGLQVLLDGRLMAGLPTAAAGPTPGGRYAIALLPRGLYPGKHTVLVKIFHAAATQPVTVLTTVTVT